MLSSVTYRSISTIPSRSLEGELKRLQLTCNRNNAPNHITGCLIHHDGYFVQILEGKQLYVTDLFVKIAQDARHRQVELIHAGPLEFRKFDQFEMFISHITEIDAPTLSRFCSVDQFCISTLTARQIEHLALQLGEARLAQTAALLDSLKMAR